MITPNAHEKSEWSRLATAAYASGRNDIGHRYSTSASLPHDGALSVERFDMLQEAYRAWLIAGFKD